MWPERSVFAVIIEDFLHDNIILECWEIEIVLNIFKQETSILSESLLTRMT